MELTKVRAPWPDWQMDGQIGKGQFGTVYKISRTMLGITEFAAMKVISIPNDPQQISADFSYGYDKESIAIKYKSYLDDIIKEYQLMMTVKGNPNIVRCDDVSISPHEDGIGWDVFIRMECLNPCPFLRRDDYHFNEADVIKLGLDICRALKTCEEHNIIHRDIKPSNILISDQGDYKLGDFGVSRTLEHENTYGTKGIGTYDYMAPEIYRGEKYGKEADIYSLGMVMYWLLNDRTFPFLIKGKAPTISQIQDARDRRFGGVAIPPPVNGSSELIRIVLKACEYEPKNRYHSADDMRNALGRLNDGMGSFKSTDDNGAYNSDDRYQEATWSDTNKTVGKQYYGDASSTPTVGSINNDSDYSAGKTPEYKSDSGKSATYEYYSETHTAKDTETSKQTNEAWKDTSETVGKQYSVHDEYCSPTVGKDYSYGNADYGDLHKLYDSLTVAELENRLRLLEETLTIYYKGRARLTNMMVETKDIAAKAKLEKDFSNQVQAIRSTEVHIDYIKKLIENKKNNQKTNYEKKPRAKKKVTKKTPTAKNSNSTNHVSSGNYPTFVCKNKSTIKYANQNQLSKPYSGANPDHAMVLEVFIRNALVGANVIKRLRFSDGKEFSAKMCLPPLVDDGHILELISMDGKYRVYVRIKLISCTHLVLATLTGILGLIAVSSLLVAPALAAILVLAVLVIAISDVLILNKQIGKYRVQNNIKR